MISKTNTVTPFFFAFLTKVDHYLSAWQVYKKKSERGNILGANVLNITQPRWKTNAFAKIATRVKSCNQGEKNKTNNNDNSNTKKK